MSTLIAAVFAGYALGRVRPCRRLVDWNWERTIYGRPVRSADVVLFVALHPVLSARTYRHRHEPTHRDIRLPAPEVGPRWRGASR